jgi:MoaD family protein
MITNEESIMPVKVLLPTPLRSYTEHQPAVSLAGTTVGEVLSELTTRYPSLHRHLFTDDGKLRSYVNVYVNDQDIRYLQKEQTPLEDNDTVSIIPSIAGGRNA